MAGRRLQFRLRTLLLAPVAVGLAIVTYPYWSALDLRPVEQRPIAWQPFTQAALEEAKASGQPVLVKFHADWDITGKWIAKTAMETADVRRFIVEHQVLALSADWTEPNEDVRAALKAHGIASIPLTVIYAPDAPDAPILLCNLYTEQQLLVALRQAAPHWQDPLPWNPFMSPWVGALGVLFLIGLAHVLARTHRDA